MMRYEGSVRGPILAAATLALFVQAVERDRLSNEARQRHEHNHFLLKSISTHNRGASGLCGLALVCVRPRFWPTRGDMNWFLRRSRSS